MKTSILIYYVISILISFVACKSESVQPHQTTKFDFDDYKKGISIKNWFTSIDFLELDRSFASTLIPNKLITFQNNFFILWKYRKIGVFNKNGELLDSIKSEKNTLTHIGSIQDFQIFQDKLFVLTGDKIYTYSHDNLSKPIKSITLSDYYNSFGIYNNGFILFNAIGKYLLEFINWEGELIKTEFSTLNSVPTIRPDQFPHFTYFSGNESLLFYFQYDPYFYKIDINSGNISKFHFLNLNNYKIDQNQLNSLIRDPTNMTNEMNIANTKFCYFNKVERLNNSIFYTYKVNKKFYYSLLDHTNKRNITFNHFINDTDVPFMDKQYMLEFIGSDNNDGLIFYIEYENLLKNSDKLVSTSKLFPSNWNDISGNISSKSGPILAVLKLK